MSGKLIVLIVCVLNHQVVKAGVPQPSKYAQFAHDLFSEISKNNIDTNIIFSPYSIELTLGSIYIGASGRTAKELAHILSLPIPHYTDKNKAFEYFTHMSNEIHGDVQLTVASKIFLNSGYVLRPTFSRLALNHCKTHAQTLNFFYTEQALGTINLWVKQATNNKIPQILEQGSVEESTDAVLANAVYFNGGWEKDFYPPITSTHEFFTNQYDVDLIYLDDHFLYAELAEWDATSVRLPYKNSDLLFTVTLPKKLDGLADLEQKMRSNLLPDLTDRYRQGKVSLFLPKFKFDFSLSLNDVLQELGIRAAFSDSADLNGIIQSGPPLKISSVVHKAFIELDEAGTDAGAASDIKTPTFSMVNTTSFIADHPFVFTIAGPNHVYFMGHVVNIERDE